MNSWRTTSAGILMIVAALTGLAFAIKNNAVTEAVITGCATGIVGGVGLILSKDKQTTGGTELNKNNDPKIVQRAAKVERP